MRYETFVLWLLLNIAAIVAALIALALDMDPLWAACGTYALGGLLVIHAARVLR